MEGSIARRTRPSVTILLKSHLRSANILSSYEPRKALRLFPWTHISRAHTAEQFPKIRKFDALLGGRKHFSDQPGFRGSNMSTNLSNLNTTITTPDPNQHAENDNRTPETGYESLDNDEELGDDSYDEVEYRILARPLFDFIIRRVSNINKGAHTDHMKVTDFKAFWREKFDKMRLELAHSQESDLFITDPPLKELEIEILDNASEKECPCRLNFTNAQIVLRAERGITRDIFLRGLEDHLYGEGEKSEHLRLSDRHHGMLIPRDWEYMQTEEDVLYKGGDYDAMRIWLYCSDKVISDDQQVSAVAKL